MGCQGAFSRSRQTAGHQEGRTGRGAPAGVRWAGQHGVVLTASSVTEGMRRRLAEDPWLSVSMSGRYADGADEQTDAQVRAALHRALPGTSVQVEEVLHASVPLVVPLPAGSAAEVGAGQGAG